MTHTGNLIRKTRIEFGLSQNELAQKIGMPYPQSLSLIETGHAALPIKYINKTARVLGIPLIDLLDVMTEDYADKIRNLAS